MEIKRNMKNCCVCYDSFDDLVKLECGHEFCEKCADSIINHTYSLKCALCRKHSYHIEHEKLDKKIFNVQLYGSSYIEWEMNKGKKSVSIIINGWFLGVVYFIHRIYWYYGYEYPYTYHNPMIRSYKCKI